MNNLMSYCGLVAARISASDKDLQVQVGSAKTTFGRVRNNSRSDRESTMNSGWKQTKRQGNAYLDKNAQKFSMSF